MHVLGQEYILAGRPTYHSSEYLEVMNQVTYCWIKCFILLNLLLLTLQICITTKLKIYVSIPLGCSWRVVASMADTASVVGDTRSQGEFVQHLPPTNLAQVVKVKNHQYWDKSTLCSSGDDILRRTQKHFVPNLPNLI